MLTRYRNFKNKKSSLYNAHMLFSSPATKKGGVDESVVSRLPEA